MSKNDLDEASTLLIGMKLCDFHDHIMDLLTRRGVRVGALAPELAKHMSGLNVVNDIRLDGNLPFPRRIIVLFHEIGHYMVSVRINKREHYLDATVGYGLSDDGSCFLSGLNDGMQFSLFDGDYDLKDNQKQEDRADKFAYRAIRLLRKQFLSRKDDKQC